VVDATNYVMFELNQPLHPYDLARLKGPALIARRATEGERLVTLDDVERKLTADMTVIADAAGAVGIAGVMGAAHVEVSAETKDVLLECAWFEPRGVRRTRRDLGISSEASYRFERGVDLWNTPECLRRCTELILATAGGEISEAPIDLFPQPYHPPRVFLRPARVTQILGIELPWSAVEKALTAIGATVLSKPDDGRIAVDVPGWRPDITTEIDLIEEIARIYGYESIPTELRPFRVGTIPDAPIELVELDVRRGLAAWGLYEVSTLPMSGDGPNRVKLVNPLSSEEGWLRNRLVPGLVRQAEVNWRAHTRSARLFEVGTVFRDSGSGLLPEESRHVAGIITGGREPDHWTAPAADFDQWDLQGLFTRALSLAVPGATVQVEGNSWVGRTPDGRVVGRAGPLDADSPPWAAPLFGFELEIDPAPRPVPKAKPLPVTPASERDLALLLPVGVTAARTIAVITGAASRILEQVRVTDEYRGKPLPPEVRNVVFRLVFRAPDRTLEKAEVDQACARVVKTLESELGVHLREA
jgi:phenylalanyl-tRNA synthetase beta chain